MPKDEFDFDDPLALHGWSLPTPEDTSGEMADCFIEELARAGYDSRKILGLFRDPHYRGPHLALTKRGEAFIRERITEVFARRGQRVRWLEPEDRPPAAGSVPNLQSCDL